MALIDTGRGQLGVIEFSNIQFVPRRLFWISSVPSNSIRGSHAHIECLQLVIVQAGAVEYRTIDAVGTENSGILQTGDQLFVPAMTWLELKNFAEGAVVAVLASHPYDENDYIRDWNEFVGRKTNQI